MIRNNTIINRIVVFILCLCLCMPATTLHAKAGEESSEPTISSLDDSVKEEPDETATAPDDSNEGSKEKDPGNLDETEQTDQGESEEKKEDSQPDSEEETLEAEEDTEEELLEGEEDAGLLSYDGTIPYTSTYPSDWAAPTVSNLILFVAFSDGEGGSAHVDKHSESSVLTKGICALNPENTLRHFNGSASQKQSMQRYLYNISYGQLRVDNLMPQYDATNNTIVPIVLDRTADKYGNPQNDGLLISEVIRKCNAQNLVPSGLKLDRMTSGMIDNLTIVLLTDSEDQNTVFDYSYKSFAGSGTIQGKTVGNYNILPEESIYFALGEAGTIAHEFLHSMGYPDLYRANSSSDVTSGVPVYRWCIMSSSDRRMLYPLAYLRSAYSGWFSMDTITQDTTGITLFAPTKTDASNKDRQAVVLKTPYSDKEFFVVEYRQKSSDSTQYDSSLPGTGLIVYRVNTEYVTNKIGPPDMIYIFRKGDHMRTGGGENAAFEDGGINASFLSAESGRTSYGLTDLSKTISDNAITYADGQNSGIVIENVGSAGDSITFDVSFNENISDLDYWKNSVNQNNGSTGVFGAIDSSDGTIYALEYPSGKLYKFDGTNYTCICNTGLPTTGFATDLKVYNGNVYAVYSASSKTRLMKFTGSSWSLIKEYAADAADAKLSVGSDGLYLAYSYDSYKIAVAKYNGSSVTNVGTTITENGYMFGNLALEVDGSTPYVSYRNASGDVITVKKWNGSAWDSLPMNGLIAGNTCLAVQDHTLYLLATKTFDGGYNKVFYYDESAQSWSAVGGEFTDKNVGDASLQMVNGAPYILFTNNGNSVQGAYWSNGEWKALDNVVTESSYGMSAYTFGNHVYMLYIATNGGYTKIVSTKLKQDSSQVVPKVEITFHMQGSSLNNGSIVCRIPAGTALVGEEGNYCTELNGLIANIGYDWFAHPVRIGYTFRGWYTQSEGGTQVDFTQAFSANADVYARWEENQAPDPGAGEDPEPEEPEAPDWGDIVPEDRTGFASPEEVPDVVWISGVEDCDYTGAAITFPNLRVYDGKKLLTKGTHYAVSYKNNLRANDAKVDAKAPTVIVTGRKDYAGTYTRTFVIRPLSLSVTEEEGRDYSVSVSDLLFKYTGKVQLGKPQLTCKTGQKEMRLKQGSDYTISYQHADSKAADYDENAYKLPNLGEAPYVITLTGQGNYSGTRIVSEYILPQGHIAVSALSVKVEKAQYTGQPVKPPVTVKYGSKTLQGMEEAEYEQELASENAPVVDYTYRYEDNIDAGTGRIVITGRGDYHGTRADDFTIRGMEMTKLKVTGLVSSFVYCGSEIEQKLASVTDTSEGQSIGEGLALYYEETVDHVKRRVYLTPGTDFEVRYENNVHVGKATIYFDGKGKYTGTFKQTYKITAYNLNEDDYLYPDGSIGILNVTTADGGTFPVGVAYQKDGATVEPVITFEHWRMPEGEILEPQLLNSEVLGEGISYKVSYLNNKQVNHGEIEKNTPRVRIIGKGDFSGDRTKETFFIETQKIDAKGITIEAKDKVATPGKSGCKTTFVIYDRNGKKLVRGTDYEKTEQYCYDQYVTLENGTDRMAGAPVEDTDVVPAGTRLSVTVKGIGNYEDTITGKFRVVANDFGKAKVIVKAQLYTGREVYPDKSQITVLYNKQSVDESAYDILKYENNVNTGKAKITLRGKGSFGGTVTATFTITKKPISYTVKYAGNGATNGSMKSQNGIFGKAMNLSANSFGRKEYKFMGWNTKADGSGTSYADEALFNPALGDGQQIITLYAQWYHNFVGVNSVSLNQTKISREVGDTYLLQAVVLPSGASFKEVSWDSSNEQVATVDAEGLVSVVGAGMAIIRATTKEGIKGQCLVEAGGGNAVELGTDYINVSDYYATGVTDTQAINAAIEAATGECNTVYIPAGTYEIDVENAGGIRLKSNVNLYMDADTILQARTNGESNYNILKLPEVSNVTISGGQIVGDRQTHTSTVGEWGHGIGVYDSRKVRIMNVDVSDCWGDGIYLGSPNDEIRNDAGCDGVEITNSILHDNRRNNLSIVAADNVLVSGCTLEKASGTAPESGCDIETNNDANPCEHISFYHCNFQNNVQGSLKIIRVANDVEIVGCTLNGELNNWGGKNVTLRDSDLLSEVYARLGIVLGEGVRINDGGSTEDVLVASYEAKEDTGKWVPYNVGTKNPMKYSLVDDCRLEGGKAFRMERTGTGSSNAGYSLDLSEITCIPGMSTLAAGQKYRFEYVMRGTGQWAIRTTQNGRYPIVMDEERYLTGFVTYEAQEADNCRLMLYAEDMTKGMFLQVESVKIYLVK